MDFDAHSGTSPFLIASISRPVKNQTPVPVSPARITWVHPCIVCFHCSPGPASRIHSCNEPDRTRASGSTNCTSQVAGVRGISPIPPWRICAGICSQMGPATAMESVTPKKGISHCEQEELLGITEQIKKKMPANLVSLQIPSAALSFEIGPSMPNEAIPHRCFWHIQRSCIWNTNLGNMKKRKLTKDNLGSCRVCGFRIKAVKTLRVPGPPNRSSTCGFTFPEPV